MIAANKNNEVLVSVENISKKFCRDLKRSLWYGVKDITAEILMKKDINGILRKDEFWAVEDVSFELRRGECLGLIGANGGGKSTLLKLLNGLICPDRGRIVTRGRVGALIELGAGFNPILTGRENIFVNGAVLGLSREEVKDRFDDIVEFSELSEFINTPVQSYSTGMRVRLGFAIAAHMNPDVLLIDEVLAVGDAGFRAKCYNRIAELAEHCAVILVSHNMSHVARLAHRSLVVNRGKVEFIGDTPEAINVYYSMFSKGVTKSRHGSQQVRTDTIEFINSEGETTDSLNFGKAFAIRLQVTANAPIGELVVNVVFQTIGQQVVAQCNNYVLPHSIQINSQCELSITMQIERLTLNPGVYQVSCLLMSPDMTTHYDWLENVVQLTVKGGRPAGGVLQFVPQWQIETRQIHTTIPEQKG
jgi:lipopolysaccharide transport system ATP-binding protein